MNPFVRWLFFIVVALLGLQVFFVGRVVLMASLNPQSTSFERSQAWQVAQGGPLRWRQEWVDYEAISDHLKRAVIASEDDDFVNHSGVQWDAIEQAWQKNSHAAAQAQKVQSKAAAAKGAAAKPVRAPKIVGGSTITQQLAKNLLLSGERNFLRKGQEFLLTAALETFLSKQRILEIYLNHVEWGSGVFGAQAAAQHYFRKNAADLSPQEAARLAVMLPRPKYFEKLPNSAYLAGRAQAIAARMGSAELP